MNDIKSKLVFPLLLIIFVLGLNNCAIVKPYPYRIATDFHSETGIDAVYVQDTCLLRIARNWQGNGDYLGIDKWITAKLPNNIHLYGGLPGQSGFYTISQTLEETDTILDPYWESLQVKPHPVHGYRPKVGVYRFEDSLVVAIAKTLKNPKYGKGGGWQIFVIDFESQLIPIDTISLYKIHKVNK